MIDLSILVPSLHSRNVFRSRLLAQIAAQPDEYLRRCQVLVDIDSRQNSLGVKRNRMIETAVGQYVVFIDDDDQIYPNYLKLIFGGIDAELRREPQPDAIGIRMTYMPMDDNEDGMTNLVICSMKNGWEKRGEIYYRPIQHTCPVKKELVEKVGFPDWNYHEDEYFAKRIGEYLETEHLIGESIYLYEDRGASRKYRCKEEDIA